MYVCPFLVQGPVASKALCSYPTIACSCWLVESYAWTTLYANILGKW